MKVYKYIRDFEQLGFGMFVHFGLYSIIGKGEWIMKLGSIPTQRYEWYMNDFQPASDWAEQLVQTAAEAGCRYITLTARHHDGFSLYDTHGLNNYDAMHACSRDLIREFIDACNEAGILPILYHTLPDWHEPSYQSSFSAYLEYLRSSIELLCTQYGKLGGIWLDGMWDRPDADWEEDDLYKMIRKYQPKAMIINNSGLNHRGEPGNPELDSVTFERGKPVNINQEGNEKYIASEMCETLNDHWGYAADDLHYKAAGELIEELALCRRTRSNFLLNTGLKGNGMMRSMDREIFHLIGQWTKLHDEALHQPETSAIDIQNKKDDFLLKKGNIYYLFCFHLPMQADPDAAQQDQTLYEDCFHLSAPIKKVSWMDNGEPVRFFQNDDSVCIYTEPFPYGSQSVVRIARIITS